MNRFEQVLLVITVALGASAAAILLAADGDAEEYREPVPDTAANVGKCIQGHRVLWQETRAQAAEACLASLDKDGEQTFSQTWHNYETEVGSW